MKLGVLALAAPENGGSFQYTLSTLESLARQTRLTTTLYTSSGNPHYDHMGFPTRRVDMSRFHQMAYTMLEPALQIAADPFCSEDAVLAPIYSPLLLRTRKPFAYTLHDLQERHYPHNFTFAQRTWRRHIHRRLTARATRIICESECVKADIIANFHVEEGRVAVIVAPPISRSGEALDAAALRAVGERYCLPANFAFYPAQFWPHKNHLRLIEAFRTVADVVPDAHLVLTGRPGHAYGDISDRVAALGLSERILHLGYVDDADLPGLYRLARMLVMPSLFESVSIPVYEAFQAQTAVAASNVEALPDQIGDAGLLFDPVDADAMARAMIALFTDHSLRDSLADRGARRLSSLTPERYGSALADLAEELIVPVNKSSEEP